MHYNSVEFLPSYPSLELGENTSKDICHLATDIIGSSTAKAAILKLPRDLATFLSPHFKGSKIEKLIWEHIRNKSSELLVLEDEFKNPDILADIETISAYSPLFLIIAALHDSDGGILGFMCIYDTRPNKMTNGQERSIKILSRQAALLGILHNPHGLTKNQGTFVDNKRLAAGNFLETNDSLLWRLNGITGNFWCNELVLDILGYGPDELHLDSFATWLDLVYYFDQDKVNGKFQAWLENNLKDEELECRLLHKSGEIVFVTIRVLNTSYKKNGSVYQIEGDIQNITSQKKVWEQIELIHPKYTSVIQAGYDWLSIVDLKGTYTYVNPIWESALGYCSDELIGKNIFSNVHGSDKKKVNYYFSKFIKNEPFVSKPFRFKHKSGSWKWLEILMVNLNDDPMIQGIVINARDITDRVMTYQEIKASEEKHRLLFTNSPYPKYILELESCKIVDVNDAMMEFYGYSRAELLHMSAKDLRPKEEIGALLKGLEVFQFQTGPLMSGIYTHKKKNGELVKMEIVGQSIRIDGVRCALATCTDVTEREEYLNKLKHSENKLKSATTIAKLGYWSIDLKDMSLNCSEEVYRIWERDPDTFQLNYGSFMDSMHPNDREQFERENERAISQSRKYDHVYRIIIPDNTIKWVRHLGQPELIINGSPSKLEGTVQDITQQKMEEHRLRLLESVVTNTKDAVLITEAEPIDESGPRILYVNEAFTKMTGYPAEEVVGRTPRILQGPKSDRAELKRLKEALHKWEPSEITIINYKKNGEEFWVNFSISPVADEKGCFTHWISIERDVTVEKNQELLNNLMIDISLIFGHEKYLRQCLKSVLDHFVDIGGFTLAEIWLPKSENIELKPSAEYNIVRIDTKFHNPLEGEESLGYLGELVNGIREKQSLEVWNIGKLKNPHKKRILETLGMECVMGTPLVHNKKFIGVLLLGAEHGINSQLYRSEPFKEVAGHLAAEIKRKHIETELEHVFNFAPDILCKAGKDGYFKKINPAASKLLGYSEEELLSKKIIEFVHPEDRERTRNKQLFLYTGKSYKHFENRYLSKNGETIWLSWTARSNEEEDAIFAVAKDVTENRELKGILNEVTDLALIGTWELSFNRSTIYWSPMVKKIHEVDRNYVPTIESVLGFYKDGPTRERILQEINNAIHKGEPWDLELPIITAKGNERWVRMIGKPEFAFGKCFRIIGSIQDINDLKTAELKMQQANNDKNDILKSIGDAFISLDHEWTITYWNEKAKELLGVDNENTVGKNFWGFKWNNINAKDYLKYYRRIRAGNKVYLEEYIPTLNKWLEISAYPSESKISLYIKDITEKRQIQSAVEKQNEKLREIAWTQSHLVRAPLARLMGIIDLFHEDLVDDSEKKQMLDHIYSSATELDTIIKEIVSKSQSVISNE
jgi:PAS domain S-box-containing protein